MMGINFVTVALTNNEKQKAPRDNFDKSIEGKLSTWFINTFPVYPVLISLHLTRSNSLLSQVCFCDFPLSNFTKKEKSDNKISQGSDPAYSFCFLSFSFFNSQKEKQTEILEKYGWFSIFFSRIWNKIFPTRPFLLMFSVCFMSFATTFPSAWKTLPVLLHTMSYHWSCPVLFSLKTPSYEHCIKKHIKYAGLVLKFHIMLSNWKFLLPLSYLLAILPHSQMPKKIGTCFQHYFLEILYL